MGNSVVSCKKAKNKHTGKSHEYPQKFEELKKPAQRTAIQNTDYIHSAALDRSPCSRPTELGVDRLDLTDAVIKLEENCQEGVLIVLPSASKYPPADCNNLPNTITGNADSNGQVSTENTSTIFRSSGQETDCVSSAHQACDAGECICLCQTLSDIHELNGGTCQSKCVNMPETEKTCMSQSDRISTSHTDGQSVVNCSLSLTPLESVKLHVDNLRDVNPSLHQELRSILDIVRKSSKSDQSAISKYLIGESVLKICTTYLEEHNLNSCMLKRDDADFVATIWPTLKLFIMLFWILCDACVNFCQYILSSNLFIFLMSELRYMSQLVNNPRPTWEIFFMKSILGILHNISRHVPNSKWHLRNEGIVAILQMVLSSEIPMVRVKSLILLSYIISEAENEIINSKDGNISFILQVLSDAVNSPNHMSSKYGMSAAEILKGLNNLAINDENKIRIVQNGALELYEKCLADGTGEEKKLTIVSLWSLAFHHYNKRKMRGMPGIMDRLHELQQGDDDEICHAARGTVWELDNTSKTVIGASYSSSSAEKHDTNVPHIMISYQWDSQPVMVKVKDRLKHAGYKVWMDVEHMTGSTLEAMALAVEQAAVVLVCMSQRYKDSPNCRTEAEYVYRRRKDFVPLRLQDEYIPDGWLGILVGTRLYFDLYAEDAVDAQIPRLIKELRDRGKISPVSDVRDAAAPVRCGSRDVAPILTNGTTTEVRDWGCSDIGHWLASLGAGHLSAKIPDMDGSLLLELQHMQVAAPHIFYSMLKVDFDMSPIEVLTFSKLLRSLR